ncbi:MULTISPECIES: cytochrome P450 [Streptomyces]|uniref:Cytochrome P450 n=1 Tax=Streptomyces sanyensis TaxID=568869 RepID=A0ABP8ZNT9_9ACTN
MRITSPDRDARVPLAGVDLYDPVPYRDACQHTLWQTLREEAPVWWQKAPNGTGFWNFTRHADVDQLLKDHRRFSSEDGTILSSVGVGDAATGKTMTVTDPPRHAQLRNPVMQKLGRAMIRRCTEQLRAEVGGVVAPLLADRKGDFVGLMHSLPMAMLAPMMGIPEELREEIAHWSAVSIAPDEPGLTGGLDAHTAAREAHVHLLDLFGAAIRMRAGDPGDDVMTALTGLLLDGEPLTEWHVALNYYSLMMGAHATTPHVAGHIVTALVERPHLWSQVRADPSLIPALVDEGTRWTSPTHHLVRRADVDTELGGQAVRKGDWLCGWVGSANRDHAVWDDPYEFRIDRGSNPHLGFGVGPHYCIGALVSRAALTVLFEILAEHVERFELPEEPRHLTSNWINGMARMDVVLHLGERS